MQEQMKLRIDNKGSLKITVVLQHEPTASEHLFLTQVKDPVLQIRKKVKKVYIPKDLALRLYSTELMYREKRWFLATLDRQFWRHWRLFPERRPKRKWNLIFELKNISLDILSFFLDLQLFHLKRLPMQPSCLVSIWFMTRA